MQLSNLIILELVRCGEFVDLLIEEGDVGLVLGIEGLSLPGHIGEGLLEVKDLVAVCFAFRRLILF